jgi:hypothetical protein
MHDMLRAKTSSSQASGLMTDQGRAVQSLMPSEDVKEFSFEFSAFSLLSAQ